MKIGYTEGMGHVHREPTSLTWGSFDGKIQRIEDIDHSHLSNIFYWTHVVCPESYDDTTRKIIELEINSRFGGKVLKYSPLRRFEGEILLLESKGWLKEEDGVTKVIVGGLCIGEVCEKC